MPGYVEVALKKFQHLMSFRLQYAPHPYSRPDYSVKTQFTPDADKSAPLTADGIQQLQQVVGTFLFYGRAIDYNALFALGNLAAEQAKGTKKTAENMAWFLNYMSTNLNATLQYHASGMVLHYHSNASYLSEPKARSRAGDFFYLSYLE